MQKQDEMTDCLQVRAMHFPCHLNVSPHEQQPDLIKQNIGAAIFVSVARKDHCVKRSAVLSQSVPRAHRCGQGVTNRSFLRSTPPPAKSEC